MFKTIKSF